VHINGASPIQIYRLYDCGPYCLRTQTASCLACISQYLVLFKLQKPSQPTPNLSPSLILVVHGSYILYANTVSRQVSRRNMIYCLCLYFGLCKVCTLIEQTRSKFIGRSDHNSPAASGEVMSMHLVCWFLAFK
jgi:hypothetical protein